MKPFLLIATRAVDRAADSEYEAMRRFAGLSHQQLHRVRAEQAPIGPIDLADWSGIILGGGPFNASDEEKSPTQQRVEAEIAALLDDVVAEDFPFLGACYGIGTLGLHQGAIVDRTFSEPVGAKTIRLTDQGVADPLFGALPETFEAFLGHKEAIAELPDHAVRLASSDTCPVQAFRIRANVYATQFHPELDVEGIQTRIDVYAHAGYFEPHEAEGLKTRARAARVTAPPEILRGFIRRYARDHGETGERRLPRRQLMRSAGLLAVAALASGCTEGDPSDVAAELSEPASGEATQPASAGPTPSASGDPTPSTSVPPRTPALPDPVPAEFEDLPICQTTRSAAEGPFPNLEVLDRRDITEGRPGQPVQLGLRVVDAECRPIDAAVVTVWHADHSGDYSSYTDGGSGKDEGAGTTFLRGQQTSGADGIVVFDTVFPGWYEGRAIHIHLSVEASEGRQLTTQLYFAEDLTADVLTAGPYAEFGQPDTSIEADGLAGDPASEGTQLVSRRVDESIQALLNIGLV